MILGVKNCQKRVRENTELLWRGIMLAVLYCLCVVQNIFHKLLFKPKKIMGCHFVQIIIQMNV